MTDIEKLETQRFSDDCLFFEWWRNIIELNDMLTEDWFLNKYYIRSFFIHLYELIVSGVEYSHYARTWNKKDLRYSRFEEFINVILDNISEDEFFMITYYRNSGCHIFLSHYSWIKSYNSDQLKPAEKPMNFRKKDGATYTLTQEEIRNTVKRVIGDYGLGQDLFKRNLFKRLSPIILKYEIHDLI